MDTVPRSHSKASVLCHSEALPAAFIVVVKLTMSAVSTPKCLRCERRCIAKDQYVALSHVPITKLYIVTLILSFCSKLVYSQSNACCQSPFDLQSIMASWVDLDAGVDIILGPEEDEVFSLLGESGESYIARHVK